MTAPRGFLLLLVVLALLALGAVACTAPASSPRETSLPEAPSTEPTVAPPAPSSEAAAIEVLPIDATRLPAELPPLVEFVGGAELQPDGAVFDDGVTVRLPLQVRYPPGWPLEVLSERDGSFEPLDVVATVDDSGTGAVVTLDHFSTYALVDGFTRCSVEYLANQIVDSGGSAQEVVDAVRIWLDRSVTPGTYVGPDRKVIGAEIVATVADGNEIGRGYQAFGRVPGAIDWEAVRTLMAREHLSKDEATRVWVERNDLGKVLPEVVVSSVYTSVAGTEGSHAVDLAALAYVRPVPPLERILDAAIATGDASAIQEVLGRLDEVRSEWEQMDPPFVDRPGYRVDDVIADMQRSAAAALETLGVSGPPSGGGASPTNPPTTPTSPASPPSITPPPLPTLPPPITLPPLPTLPPPVTLPPPLPTIPQPTFTIPPTVTLPPTPTVPPTVTLPPPPPTIPPPTFTIPPPPTIPQPTFTIPPPKPIPGP